MPEPERPRVFAGRHRFYAPQRARRKDEEQGVMKEIQRISITDAIVDSIRDMIESGEYAIGDRLPTEARLCELMNVSRSSLREAIRVLQALGYVQIQPGRGTFVTQNRISIDNEKWFSSDSVNFTSFMEVRMALELLAVRLAAEHCRPGELDELKEIHASFVEADKEKDCVRLIMLDELFHSKIMAISKNSLLVSINAQLLEAFRVFRSSSFANEEFYHNAVEPHGRIVDSFAAKDPDRAVQEMKQHLEITARDMASIHKTARPYRA